MPLLNYLLPLLYTNNCIFCKGIDNGNGLIAEIKAKYRGEETKQAKENTLMWSSLYPYWLFKAGYQHFFFFAENGLFYRRFLLSNCYSKSGINIMNLKLPKPQFSVQCWGSALINFQAGLTNLELEPTRGWQILKGSTQSFQFQNTCSELV